MSNKTNGTADGTKHVAYYRVSTRKQKVSGLGLDAQKHAVETYLKGTPDWTFEETESGRKTQRPELQRALACCKQTKSVLVIAKLDRLARNAAFVLSLKDAGVEFVALDCPYASRLTITILAAVAEQEATWISERTKAGLAAAKRKGVVLGNPRPAKSIKRAHASRQRNSQAFVDKFQPIIRKMQGKGITTLQEIADSLNLRGYTSRTGKPFYPSTVRNLLLAMDAK